MKTYAKAPESVSQRVLALIAEYHPDLHSVGVKVDCLSIANSEPDEPALLLHGYPCAAVVRVLPSKDRAMGRGDAEITIDEAQYAAMSAKEQDALLDHELTHLQVKKKPSGRACFDEHNRPELKMRLHDRQFGWSDEIARRHGSASGEIKQAVQFYLSAKQTYFVFALAGGDKAATATVKLMR